MILPRWIAWVGTALLLCTSACQDLTDLKDDCAATSAAVKAEMGVDAQCTFRSFRGSSGSRLAVSIHLAAIPAGEAAALKTRVTSIVSIHFRVPVTQLTVSL